MNLTFSEDQLALRAEVAEFLEKERAAGSFTPAVDAWITGFDRDFTKKMAARGWIGLTWPTAYGGGGRTLRRPALHGAAPGRRRSAGRPLVRRPADGPVDHQPRDRRAEGALPARDPGRGRRPTASACRSPRPAATWPASAPGRSAPTPGGYHRAQDLDQPGPQVRLHLPPGPDATRRRNATTAVGVRSSRCARRASRSARSTTCPGAHHFNEVFFDEVAVDGDALIGTEGGGWRQITGQLGYERAGLERIMSVWALLRAMRAAVGDDERRQEELGALKAAARVARQLVFRAAAVADSGRPPDHEAAMAKVFATDIEQKMVEVASQWAGPAAGEDRRGLRRPPAAGLADRRPASRSGAAPTRSCGGSSPAASSGLLEPWTSRSPPTSGLVMEAAAQLAGGPDPWPALVAGGWLDLLLEDERGTGLPRPGGRGAAGPPAWPSPSSGRPWCGRRSSATRPGAARVAVALDPVSHRRRGVAQ